MPAVRDQIQQNVEAHDAIADRYEDVHGEIFNPYEQHRLSDAVTRALNAVGTGVSPLRALDVGCGSGNVTRLLLAAGCVVTAADVSSKFLEICAARYGDTGRLYPVLLEGSGLGEFRDGSFDLVTAYSVMHHVPDYLALAAEMVRVVAPGGVIYLDHESSERVYQPDPTYDTFTRITGRPRSPIKAWLTRTRARRRLVHGIRAVLRPGFQTEGDIHVWPDDHIEFERLQSALQQRGCTVLEDAEYLLHRRGVEMRVYEAYAGRCVDMRMLIARRGVAGSQC